MRCRRPASRRLHRHAAALPELHLQRSAERHRDDDRRRPLDVRARRLFLPHARSCRRPARFAAASPARCAATSRASRRGRACRPTASGWRSSTTTTWRSARSAATSARALSTDGSEGNYYDGASIVWSPDSTKLAAYRVRPGYRRLVHYVSSSPEDQLQPSTGRSSTPSPAISSTSSSRCCSTSAARSRSPIDSRLFPNPFDLSDLVWRKDSRGFTFEYNQRGHQVYPRHRGGRADRRRPRGDLGGAEDVLLLQPLGRHAAGRQALPLRPGRRQGSGLDVGARRLEPSLPDRRRHRRGEDADHQGRVAGAPRR